MTKQRTANKVLPKAGLNGFDWTFVQGSTFVLRLNFCAKITAFGNTQNVVMGKFVERHSEKYIFQQTREPPNGCYDTS